jgi:hypothetical protein
MERSEAVALVYLSNIDLSRHPCRVINPCSLPPAANHRDDADATQR